VLTGSLWLTLCTVHNCSMTHCNAVETFCCGQYRTNVVNWLATPTHSWNAGDYDWNIAVSMKLTIITTTWYLSERVSSFLTANQHILDSFILRCNLLLKAKTHGPTGWSDMMGHLDRVTWANKAPHYCLSSGHNIDCSFSQATWYIMLAHVSPP